MWAIFIWCEHLSFNVTVVGHRMNLYSIKVHLETKTTIEPPSLVDFPLSMTPLNLWNFQFLPGWGYGYFLEPDIARKQNSCGKLTSTWSWTHWDTLKGVHGFQSNFRPEPPALSRPVKLSMEKESFNCLELTKLVCNVQLQDWMDSSVKI